MSMPTGFHYLAIEGIPGAGHHRLATLLAERFEFHCELESNWFDPFSADGAAESPLSEQLRRLVWRFEHQKSLIKTDMFRQRIVTDYLFDTHRLWGEAVLDHSARVLYKHIAEIVAPPQVAPDLVVYLQCEPGALLRALHTESKYPDPDQLTALVDGYNRFFFEYEKSPALIVRVDPHVLWDSAGRVDELLQRIAAHKAGKQYIMAREAELLGDS
jgi:deoxyadenosine/deoxycytidine kinase